MPIGYGLLGAGIVTLLDRMRRAQQRLRPTGLRIALPEGDLVELERGLRVAADPGSVDWIDLTMRLLTVTVRKLHITPPLVAAVRLRDDAVELMLEARRPIGTAPAPFRDVASGTSWILPRSGQLLEELRADHDVTGVDAPLPSLVTLGRDDRGLLMVNIERAGSVAVSGSEADPWVQAVAIELATAPWSDQIDLILVGFGEVDKTLERVSHAASVEAVCSKMERRIRDRKALLALAEHATNTDTRWLDGGDAWDLCVVVCSPNMARHETMAVRRLIEIAGEGSYGVAVVCGFHVPGARWRVRAEFGRIYVEGAEHEWPSLSPQPVPPMFAADISSLMSIAATTQGVGHDAGPYDRLAMAIPEKSPGCDDVQSDVEPIRPAPAPVQTPEVAGAEVRVLGPVEVIGARPFTRAWAVELIVYLATHPGGVSNDQWATALWPDKEMAPSSLHSTASAARRALGTTASGDDLLPRSRGRLELSPEVRSDWDSFVTLSRSPGPDDWRRALNLIRGRPFDGLRSPDWVVLEGIQATVEAVVVDLACRYAEHCLENMDAPGAEFAARQGLRVSPYDERLYRVRLRAADTAGNPAGVETVMSELVHLVADDVEPYDAVHPETLALYRKLSRRSLSSRGL